MNTGKPWTITKRLVPFNGNQWQVFDNIINGLALLIEFSQPVPPQGDPGRAIYRMISCHIQSPRINFPLDGLFNGFIVAQVPTLRSNQTFTHRFIIVPQ